MYLKNSILIVGGTGFIGYHLAKRCLKKGWDVTSISLSKPKKKRFLQNVKYLICDISNKEELRKKTLKHFKYIVNMSGHVNHFDKIQTYKSHYVGCKNLIEIFLKKKPKSFIQIGSCVEYGNARSPQRENSKLTIKLIKSTYGKAKLSATQYIINLYKKTKFPATVIRLYSVYGPKQDINRFIPFVINRSMQNKRFNCSEGDQLRDFIYINDVIDALIKTLLNKKSLGQIINIASGKPKKIKDIVKLIIRSIKGGVPQYGKVKLRPDETMKIYANIKKAKKILSWKPKILFKNGIKLTIESYYNQSF